MPEWANSESADAGQHSSFPKDAAYVAIIALVYFLAARGSLLLIDATHYPAVAWPASGLLLAGLLLARRKLWPAIMAGVFVAGALANFSTGKPLVTSLLLGIVDSVDVLPSALILLYFCKPPVTCSRLREVLVLVFPAATLSIALTALLGAAAYLTVGAPFWGAWRGWWLSNLVGVLVVTPVVLTWVTDGRSFVKGVISSRSRAMELLLSLIVLAVVAEIGFGMDASNRLFVVLPYLAFPFLIFAALKFGPLGASTYAFILTLVALWRTCHGQGPFALIGDPYDQVLQVQVFIGIAFACSLVPAAVIAERRLAEERLRQSEARLAQSQRIAHLGNFRFDKQKGKLFWSEEVFQIFGRDPCAKEPTEEEFLKFIHPDDVALVEDFVSGVMLRNKSSLIDHRIVRNDGSVRYLHIDAQPLIAANGEVTGALGTVMDVTERVKIEDQLRQAQKMEAVGRLAGGIAHDFNNLLSVIVGYSELAKTEPEITDSLRNKLEQISKAAFRGGNLTSQLLAFGRKQVLKPQILDLNGVIAELEQMLRRVIGEDVELVVALQPGLNRVKADPGQMEQVIFNLALNAKDAMSQGGKLTLRTCNITPQVRAMWPPEVPAGDYVMLSVSDTGRGMDAATQAHIFEPFFTTKEKGKGTGLGLATVYGIISQSSGYISVASVPSHGTRFDIYLPAIQEEEEKPMPVAEETMRARRTETVLLVEDEDPLRELIHNLLESLGFKVLAARNGVEAIQIANRHPGRIDLLLTDVVMPKMDGFELTKRIGDFRVGLKVLYMSGYSDEIIARYDASDPSIQFIQKPFTPEELRQKVVEVIESGRTASR